MATIYESADEFLRRVKNNKKVKAAFQSLHDFTLFLETLAEKGLRFSASMIEGIDDPQLRDYVRALAGPTVAGAAFGFAVCGPVGAAYGAGAGLLIGLLAVCLKIYTDPDGRYAIEFCPD